MPKPKKLKKLQRPPKGEKHRGRPPLSKLDNAALWDRDYGVAERPDFIQPGEGGVNLYWFRNDGEAPPENFDVAFRNRKRPGWVYILFVPVSLFACVAVGAALGGIAKLAMLIGGMQ